ncbi:AHH domain-containing protein [uncultured Sphingorhabdus sp.]|uniref:AHH domain-containing protein n=1 Tax=uncultured Sphingorhabdus sp. TaxID=1686106 RepID=UPI002608D35B|nr:AHH domain-containing protein [uncultured Sphingorhabdus sp.]HMS19349.1 AHH domain-containing protein [Sphingorhabdus sp.]
MPSFREVKRRVRVPGFHCHHIIPVEIIEKPAFKTLFGNVRAMGFDFDDFHRNGLYLPCTEQNAAAFGLPLHRGPHPVYNQVVSECIAALEKLTLHAQLLELHNLQGMLKTALRNNEVPLRKGRRNPANSDLDFESVEIAAYRLWNLFPSH